MNASNPDPAIIRRLEEIVAELPHAQGRAAENLWASARGAIMRMLGPDPRAAAVFRERSVDGLAELTAELTAEIEEAEADEDDDEVRESNHPEEDDQHAAGADITAEELKRAMRAFRKRLKLKRLDDESKLGRSPLSSGKKAEVDAIMAPREFPPHVWEELARQGKLRHAGGSFYELLE